MGYEKRKTNSCFLNLAVVKKTRGSIYTEKPVFCDNGNSLVVSSGQSLHLYNTSTGNHLKELFKCSDDIITCQLHPLHVFQLIAVTENGELTVYNLKTNEIDFSVKLRLNQKFLNKQKAPKLNLDEEGGSENFDWETQPLDSLSDRKFLHAEVKAFHNNPSEVFVWTTWCLKDELQSHLSVFTLNSGKHIRLFHIQKSGLKKCSLNFVLKTVQNFEVFVGMSTHYVHIIRFDIQKHAYLLRHCIGQEKVLTCVAFHPVECSFATGDSLGRIIIWKNIFEKQVLKNILHWHTLPVQDLYFSKFGNYLFSGGEENVLVKWSLISQNRDFLPRLSSAIHHITGFCESSLLSVSTTDNKILILDFNFQCISTIQHFSRWSVLKGENKMSIFAVDPRSNCFVLNGKTGHIQFLSINEDGKFLYTFDVTNRNFVTSDSYCAIENTEVTHAKFNRDGKWLITIESRRDGVCKESRLKFWLFCEKQNSFSLRTNVEFPHGEFGVYSLEISANDMVATTGGDNKFRLWAIYEQEITLENKQYWAVQSAMKYRNLPCYSTDFSKDASLIAVTFGPVLAVWETEGCLLKCTLSMPHGKEELKFCKFGNFECSHLVVTGTESVISTWNLITLSVVWTVPLKLSLLISDPFSIFMAAFSVDNNVIIFNPSSPTSDLILNNVIDSPVTAAHCVYSEGGKMRLYFLTSNQELFCLEDTEKVCANTSIEAIQAFPTPYSMHLPEITNSTEPHKRKPVSINKNNKQSVLYLLDSPAHTLPNPSVVCLEVLKGLLNFSENHPEDESSEKKTRNNDVVKNDNIPKNSVSFDSIKMENKLQDLVKKIFV